MKVLKYYQKSYFRNINNSEYFNNIKKIKLVQENGVISKKCFKIKNIITKKKNINKKVKY